MIWLRVMPCFACNVASSIACSSLIASERAPALWMSAKKVPMADVTAVHTSAMVEPKVFVVSEI